MARGSASDPLVLLNAISLFLLKTIHLKTLKEVITMLIYIVTKVYILCCHSFAFE